MKLFVIKRIPKGLKPFLRSEAISDNEQPFKNDEKFLFHVKNSLEKKLNKKATVNLKIYEVTD